MSERRETSRTRRWNGGKKGGGIKGIEREGKKQRRRELGREGEAGGERIPISIKYMGKKRDRT